MATTKELQQLLKDTSKEFETNQRVIRRQINNALKAEATEQEINISKNYDMGMLTLREYTEQKILVLQQLSRDIYGWDEIS